MASAAAVLTDPVLVPLGGYLIVCVLHDRGGQHFNQLSIARGEVLDTTDHSTHYHNEVYAWQLPSAMSHNLPYAVYTY